MLYIAALPWAVNKPSGLSDNEPIHSLWRYLGPNSLSGSNQNDLLGILRYQLAGQSNIAKIYRVEGTDTPQKILSVYRNRQNNFLWGICALNTVNFCHVGLAS